VSGSCDSWVARRRALRGALVLARQAECREPRCRNPVGPAVRRCYGSAVAQIFSARVRDGVIDTQGVELPEGTVVTVVVEDDNDEYVLSPDEEAELDEAIAEAERGEGIPAEDFLRQLRQSR
jgi:hypothetical protein